ncbi:MAG: HlyD family efflux transporter periplasmic adaptor subunit [Cyanobacteria bacterium P01_G01_bin.54]
MYGKGNGNGNGNGHSNGNGNGRGNGRSNGNGHSQPIPPERKILKNPPLPLPPLPKAEGTIAQPETETQTALAVRSPDPKESALVYPEIDQSVVLRQSPRWSRWILWTVVGVVTFGVGWACIAEIEQVAEATGQLKPQATVKEVQAPVDGVVQEVMVEEGDVVEAGQVLMKFDSTNAGAELKSSLAVKKALTEETQLYRSLLDGKNPQALQAAITNLKLPNDIQRLTENQQELQAENRYYQALIEGKPAQLDAAASARLRAANIEQNALQRTAQLEINQLRQQLLQAQSQLANAERSRNTAEANLQRIIDRNDSILANLDKSLQIEQRVLEDFEPLRNEAIPNLQVERQRQTVNELEAERDEAERNGNIEEAEQRQTIATYASEIAQYNAEISRLEIDIDQGQQERNTIPVQTRRESRDAIAANTKRLAEVNSQLRQSVLRVIVENEKRIQELDSKISQLRQTLNYQEVRAAVSGTVFDLKAYNGFVARPSEALLSIVPDDNLIAEVFVTNRDIGFVTPEQRADVRIDSFPFSEFGDIKGQVVSVSSDALPPDEVYNYFRFPVKVALDQQFLQYDSRAIELQSGMSASVNIKIREDRKVISLFIEMFDKQVDNLKKVR